jgi:hypothetical protein
MAGGLPARDGSARDPAAGSSITSCSLPSHLEGSCRTSRPSRTTCPVPASGGTRAQLRRAIPNSTSSPERKTTRRAVTSPQSSTVMERWDPKVRIHDRWWRKRSGEAVSRIRSRSESACGVPRAYEPTTPTARRSARVGAHVARWVSREETCRAVRSDTAERGEAARGGKPVTWARTQRAVFRPQRSRTCSSRGAKTARSTKRPMVMMMSMTAMTRLMSFNSRPMLSAKPSPLVM